MSLNTFKMQLFGLVEEVLMNSNIYEHIAQIICNKSEDISCEKCFMNSHDNICAGFSQCRIMEKTEEQLKYVASSIETNTFLSACAGSGKTEVLGMKAAYEISRWSKRNSGIAFLSFTNDATDVIHERVKQFCQAEKMYPHFIGTFSSFVHGYIVQPFAYKFANYNADKDCSIRLIDENMQIYDKHWLTAFKCEFPFISSSGKPIGIYAHQIGYDYEKKEFYFKMKFESVWAKDYYNREYVQKFIAERRKKSREPHYLEEDYFIKCIKNCKKQFFKHGLANFDDMNILAIGILKSNISKEIANRFPVIFIDECQDLSE